MFDQIRILTISASILTIIGCGSAPEETPAEKTSSSEVKSELAGDAVKGKSLFMTCSTCHGQNAEGLKALGAPALADQEPYYLKSQLQNFRTNKRGVHPQDALGAQMATMAKVLNSEGIDDVVAYIKTMTATKAETTLTGGDVEAGKAYYNMVCGACHGPGAVGIESLNSPRLVGMQDWYLERQLNNFRQGIRGKEEGDTFGAQMQLIAESIPDDKTVSDLIAYINSLQAE